MISRGQSALEWLVTHSWAILIVLSVSAVLFYSGVFDAVASPGFDGLEAASLQPLPDKVQLYSDGVMIFTVVNTRPYSVKFDYIEVAPMANAEDMLRTNIDTLIAPGDIRLFNIIATNLQGVSEASVLLPSTSSAEYYVGFNLCLGESYTAGGRDMSHSVCGKANNIKAEDTPSFEGCLIGQGHCDACHFCVPLGDTDNPDLGFCQTACPTPCHICFSGECVDTCEEYEGCISDGYGGGHCEIIGGPP